MTDAAPETRDDSTPLMKQYNDLKAKAGDALLFFRMGDFYELFGDDAVVASRILELTLTSRDKGKANPLPMAGVPFHSVQGYVQKLLRAGRKVAIGEQMEDPNARAGGPKSIVRRELVRILTPGVQFENEGSDACYLAAIVATENSLYCLACLDASTGEALVSDPLTLDGLASELAALPIRHLLQLEAEAGQYRAAVETLGASSVLVETLPSNYLARSQALDTLKRHYEVSDLGAFIATEGAGHALGVAVAYALRSQRQERLAHLRLPVPLHRPRALVLGPRLPQHLDLLPSPEGSGPNLFELINRTRSALGARQLRRWLLSPLRQPDEIAARQDAVREIGASGAELARMSSELSEVYDLERISGRVNARLANPRDTLALGRSLAALPRLASHLAGTRCAILREAQATLSRLSEALGPLSRRILKEQREEAPLLAREGGIFREGTSPDLDRLLSIGENGQRWLVELETREREATGIPSLKVRYNRVFGYYIEVTQTHLKSVPAHYQRKQTMAGAERFFTEELKAFEEEILNADTRQKALEQELFEELLASIREQTGPIMDAATALGELDSLLALARLADEPGWSFPVVDESQDLEVTQGRHPLVDLASRGAFVPNDLALSPSSRLTLLITGPNMGGKSTIMRQTALIVILGQMGAPVPAAAARWGWVSSLHTRIGAHDAIARGQSTFMVEMSELAHILHHSDARSLLILDEIGRGTSTYDGISVAWATLEWICSRIGARTLFATHYHELTKLAGTEALPLLANAHLAVEGARAGAGGSGALRFLYQLREGPSQESFGVHVARMAGLPRPVIARAWEVLEELERSHSPAHGPYSVSSQQLSLFGGASERDEATSPASQPLAAAEPHPVIEELGSVDLNAVTPLQALNLLARLREMSLGSDGASASARSRPEPRAH